jgi:hypothetical protein
LLKDQMKELGGKFEEGENFQPFVVSMDSWLQVRMQFIREGVIATLRAPVQTVQAQADPRGGRGDRVV